MPEYTIFTKKTTEYEYRHAIELPVDMGESTNRLTDRMARTAAEQGSFNLGEAEHQIGGPSESEEEVTCVMRDGIQVWPKLRKKSEPEKRVIFQAPVSEGDPEDASDPD
jgi:hypothetical protein